MNQAIAISHSAAQTAAILASQTAHMVEELHGLKKGDRIAVTDVFASPPQVYCGELAEVFSDGLAYVIFDHALTPAADHNMKTNGRVNLHWAVRV